MKKRTLLDRIRDAIWAFQGKQIGSVTFGVNVKKCSDCDRNAGVLYLCDGKYCKQGCLNADCKHTNDILHAKNFTKMGNYFWENDGESVNENPDSEIKPITEEDAMKFFEEDDSNG